MGGRGAGCVPSCSLPETPSSKISVACSLPFRSLLKHHLLRETSAPYLEEPPSFAFHNEMLEDARRMPGTGLEPGTHDNCPV